MAHSYMPSLCLPLLLLVTFAIFAPCLSVADVLPTSIFIFGDSTSDVGTNTHKGYCTFIANHQPYGRLLPDVVPTGRWSDGLHTIDYLCKLIFKYSEGSPKSFMELVKQEDPDFEQGVNFASGGSGLLISTGSEASVNPIREQLNQFKSVKEKLLDSLLIKKYTSPIWFSNAIFVISVGSNDIIQYVLNKEGRTTEQFAQDLIDKYVAFIEDLYKLGARKFGIIGVLAMGCCPGLRIKENGTCSVEYNSLSISFTHTLKSHLRELQRKYKDFKYAFGDTGSMMYNAMSTNSKTGTSGILTVFDKACCTSCYDKQNADPCENPFVHAFWDDHHPTQTASNLIANAFYYGTKATVGKKFVTPITFKKLVEGDLKVDDVVVDDDYLAYFGGFNAMLKPGEEE